MTPLARQIIATVAAEWSITPAQITSGSRKLVLVHARREVMRRLYATKRYSSSIIGQLLGRDHTTVLYSIGHSKARQPPLKLRWRKPIIMHLRCQGCRRCRIERPKVSLRVTRHAPGFLIPYAGADMSEYQWTERS